ncbi:MAG: glycolate oxidase subunit GlcE [Granulosicoccaceae bacterium]
MTEQDLSAQLQEQVLQARRDRQKLEIRGGGSKAFYGLQSRPAAQALDLSGHRGIVNYQPAELVLTARAGTPLSEIREILADKKQVLPFEPPTFGESDTLGGTMACGLSGPARPFAGSARDHVLGVRLLNGQGQHLRFGGEVMKNVAGYDTSRLMVGALGTLGVLLELSVKVLPAAAAEQTLIHEHSESDALIQIERLRGHYLPISGWCYSEGRSFTRLSGSAENVAAVARELGGETLSRAPQRWAELRDHRLPFFDDPRPLWRLSLPPGTPPLEFSGRQLLDWGGCQRWLLSDADAPLIQKTCRERGGHAELFKASKPEVFQDLDASLTRLHQNIKVSFDPDAIFNPGRISADW